MFESITGWRYVDYSTKGWVFLRWVFFLPLALLMAYLAAGLAFILLSLPRIVLGMNELPKILTTSVSYFVSGYIFILTGVKIAPKAKRIITFILQSISIVCVIYSINTAIAVMKTFNIDRTYVLYGYLTSLIGNGVAVARIVRQNYFAPLASTSTPEPKQ